MKRLFHQLLSSFLLFSLLLSGCANSQEGTTTSVSTSMLVSSSKISSAVPSVGPYSSVPVVSNWYTSLPPQPEDWKDLTTIPRTTWDVYQYYEQNPQFKEYYYKILVPLGALLGRSWTGAEDIPQTLLFGFWLEVTEDEKVKEYPRYPLVHEVLGDSPLVPAEEFEKQIEQYFDLDASLLRERNNENDIPGRERIYSEEYHAYHHGYEAPNLQAMGVYILDMEKIKDECILIYRYVSIGNIIDQSVDELWELHLQALSNGTFRYRSQAKVEK